MNGIPRRMRLLFALAILAGSAWAGGAYYEEEIAASDPHRTEQARELDDYVLRLKADDSRRRSLFKPDYASPRAYTRSVGRLRQAYAEAIGYPPPGEAAREEPRIERIGEDGIGVYYRTWIPVLPGVHAYGLYVAPKGPQRKRPLIVSMHGGGGSPEVALFRGGANYRDMVRGAIKRGYVVWAPQHLFRAAGFPTDVRNRTDDRLRLVGTTLTAVEVWKITHSLDALLKRPEVDPNRVGMVGLSYGGFYTLTTMALEPRIRAGVSSCYYGVQEYRYALDELSVPSDFRFMNRMSLFTDNELIAMICPRPLEIQAGARDNASHRQRGAEMAPAASEPYRRLGRERDFRFLVFEGGHEFHDPTAWEWMERHLPVAGS